MRIAPRTPARPWLVLLAMLALAPALGSEAVADTEYRLGGGVHYWRTLDDLEDEGFDEIDDSGLAYVLSWQAVPGGLFKFEIDLEYFEEGFGGATSEAISPQAYLIVGSGFYAALGGGIIYSDGFEDELSDPFYAARVGLDMELLPRFHIDVNANYRFDAWGELDEVDTDTVTLGAMVRFAF